MTTQLHPLGQVRLRGTERVPSDKSVTQRALLLSFAARGTTTIHHPLRSADSEAVARAVQALGASVEDEDGSWVVHGVGGRPTTPSAPLDLENSGTGARLLLGLLAGLGVRAVITGDDSLRRRPMRRVVAPLETMGARFVGDTATLPIELAAAAPLRPFRGRTEVPSAQVKSAVLLAALGAEGRTELEELVPTRDHTERMLPRFGVPCGRAGECFFVQGPCVLRSPGSLDVPADPSSAAILAAAAALFPGSEVVLRDVLHHPRRLGFFRALGAMGASVHFTDLVERDGETRATVHVRGAPLRGIELEGDAIADLVDELPLVAALATRATGRTLIRDAAELRVKESDRIAAMAQGLTALGADVTERADGLEVVGGRPLHGAALASRADHRVAMSLTLAALSATGPSTLDDPDCVRVSFPGFFETLERLAGQRILRKL